MPTLALMECETSECDGQKFLHWAKTRRATRHFRPDPITDEELALILEAGRWAPSGYNLQPIHLQVIRDPQTKARLRKVCFDQPQITEAPVILILTGDRQVERAHLEKMIAQEIEAGAIDAGYAKKIRQFVGLGFNRGPGGIFQLTKFLLAPVVHFFAPFPELPGLRMRTWLNRQAGLTAMNLMMAARAADLATCPMEGIDEARIRKILGLSRRWVIPLMISLGHARDTPKAKTRLPLPDLVSGFPGDSKTEGKTA